MRGPDPGGGKRGDLFINLHKIRVFGSGRVLASPASEKLRSRLQEIFRQRKIPPRRDACLPNFGQGPT